MARKQRRIIKTSKREKKKFNKLRNDLIFNGRKHFNIRVSNLLKFQEQKRKYPEKFSDTYENKVMKVSEIPLSFQYKMSLDDVIYSITGDKGRNYGSNRMEVLRNAVELGLEYHGKNLRKGIKLYYFIHPLQVARFVSSNNFGFVMTAASIIHDVPEEYYAKNPGTRIGVKKIINHVKNKLNPEKKQTLENYVNDVTEIVASLTKTPFEPWHKYLERLVSKDSEFLSKSIALKLSDLAYNTCDFPPLTKNSGLKPSYIFTFPGKIVLTENTLRSLENERKISLNWKPHDINKLRKANLYFAHKVCLENILFISETLSNKYVRRAKHYLKVYESKGGFKTITRKSTDKEIENAPWKRFDGTMNLLFKHWKGEEKITSLEENPQKLYDSFIGLKRVIELLHNNKKFYIK